MFRSLLFLSAFVSTNAHAYEPLVECDNGHIPAWSNLGPSFLVNSFSFPQAPLRDEMAAAMLEWHEDTVPGVNFRPVMGLLFDPGSVDTHDGENLISLINSGPCLSSTSTGSIERPSIAETTTRFSHPTWTCLNSAYIEEADMVLDQCYTFELENDYFDINDPESRAESFTVDLEAVIVHEFGHAVGFDDTHGVSTMRGTIGAGAVVAVDAFLDGRNYAVSEDDRVGMRALYGDPFNGSPSQLDLSVASYRKVDRVSQTRCRELNTQIRPTPYADLSARAVAEGLRPEQCPSNTDTDPLPDLVMFAGQEFDVEFTWFQLGDVNNSSVPAHIVLRETPNGPNIAVLDSFNTTQNANTPTLDARRVEVPFSTPAGSYLVVAEVNPGDTVDEATFDNNMAVWNQRVVIEDLPLGCACSSTGGPMGGISALVGLGLLGWRRRS